MNARELEVFRAIMRDGITAAATCLPFAACRQQAAAPSGGPARLSAIRPDRRATGSNHRRHLLFADADRVFRQIEALKTLASTIGARKSAFCGSAQAAATYSLLPRVLATFLNNIEVKIHLNAPQAGNR